MSNEEFLIFATPIYLLLGVFFKVKSNRSSNLVFYVWSLLLIILLAIGAYLWAVKGAEFSQIVSALYMSSIIWLVGPFLILAKSRQWSNWIATLVSLLLGYISVHAFLYVINNFLI